MRFRRMAFLFLAPALLVAPAALARPQASAVAADSGIAERRVAHLRHGINLSDWFAQQGPDGYTQQHFQTAITAQDLDLIRAMGFDHVRLPVDPQPMIHNPVDQIPAADFANLDAAVKMLLDRDLAVELVIFADSPLKEKLGVDDAYVEGFAGFWRTFARHYAAFDPNRVFFEIINEPEARDRYRWYGIEAM